MLLQISAQVFLKVLRQSGLIAQATLERLLGEFEAAGIERDDVIAIADRLVADGHLTGWQAAKLLKGKHKGFLLGKYRLLTLLGKGGMSSVYLAEHIVMRRQCAVKVLPTKRVKDSSYLERFQREAQAVASLDHPNIVRAYDIDCVTDGGTEIHFLVMEYVEGQSLQDLVRGSGPLSFLDCAEYMRQAASGLAHAHQAGIVHRDIKPGNLLIEKTGVVKILDLGLARYFGKGNESTITQLHDEKLLGTVDYLAPEQAMDSHAVDFRADLYGLGCSAYFALTGHAPFPTGTLPQRLISHQTKDPPPIAEDRPDVPASLESLITRMMQKQPDERFQTATEVSEAFATWLTQHAKDTQELAIRVTADVHEEQPLVPTLPLPETEIQPQETEESEVIASSATAVTEYSGVTEDGQDEDDETPEAVPVVSPLPPTETDEFPPFPDPADLPRLAAMVAQLPDFPGFDAAAQSVTTNASFPTATFAAVAEPDIPAASVLDEPGVAVGSAEDTSPTPLAYESTVTQSTRYRRRRKKQSARRPSRNIIVAGVVLLTAINAGIYYFGVLRGNDVSHPKTLSSKEQATKPTSTPQAVVKKHPDVLGHDIHVGPNGDFPSIVAALDYLQKHTAAYEPKSPQDVITISVAGGRTYPERIRIDNSTLSYPVMTIRIVSQGETPAVLAPSGPEPMISLNAIENLKIEGFDLKADGKPVAVQLAGMLPGTTLDSLHIHGFSQTAIQTKGLTGLEGEASEISLNHIVCQTESSNAVGMQLTGDSAHVQIRNGRFYGPLSAGIVLNGNARFVSIRESIFFDIGEGLRFDGSGGTWSSIIVGNNTFYKLHRGVVFSAMPGDSSTDLTFVRNLFVGLDGPETVVTKGYNAKAFYSLFAIDGIESNWSDRAVPPDASRGEHNVVLRPQKRLEGEFPFQSVDPSDAKFLAPIANSPLPKVKTKRNGFRTYVGAVPP